MSGTFNYHCVEHHSAKDQHGFQQTEARRQDCAGDPGSDRCLQHHQHIGAPGSHSSLQHHKLHQKVAMLLPQGSQHIYGVKKQAVHHEEGPTGGAPRRSVVTSAL